MVRTITSFFLVAMMLRLAMAANYTVGGPNGGWDATTNLQAWAASNNFLVGDNLIFQYGLMHDVIEVSKAGYDSCQTTSPLQSYSGGKTVIPLSSPGKRYFTCATPGHCAGGMKLEIDTLATSTLPPASPLTPPPASPLTPPPASPSLPSPPTTSTLPPASTVIPPASSPPPEIYDLSPSQSPEMTPTMPPPALRTSTMTSATSPAITPSIDGFMKTPLPSSASEESLQSSLTMGISLVIMTILLAN
ncbi:PREDICTED: uclacyanin-2-like [Populus euphratica]|uniref:Uclacyanin-2-like n=1 Tax=Populus euphratica TaxID=75702 RepID=A0AAJ6T3D2_POPEU|nr:PREDICTED: uclacyanin-2-like [Populus euphratica]